MAYKHLTFEECMARYPRLVRAIQRVGVFSSCEAGCAIRDYRTGKYALRTDYAIRKDLLRYGGGEAVQHWGGPEKLIRDAMRRRRAWR